MPVGQAQQDCCLGSQAFANLDANDNKAAAARHISSGYVSHLLHRAALFAAHPGCVSDRVTRETVVASGANCDPCHKARPLATTPMDVPCDMCSGITADPDGSPLEWQRLGGEHTRCGASTAVISGRIQTPVAAAEAWRQRQRQPKAAVDPVEHTYLRTEKDNAVMSWRNREGPCRMGPGL